MLEVTGRASNVAKLRSSRKPAYLSRSGSLNCWQFYMIINNDNVLEQNRLFHAQQHKPADVLG